MKKSNLKCLAILSAMLASCCFAFSQTPPASPTWELVAPKYGNREAIVAGYVIEASLFGNGANDATNYIQTCLDKLDTYTGETRYGGGVVYLKEGNYRINGRLKIPKGITLRGDWEQPVKGQAIKGTILQAYYGKGTDLAADGSCNQNSTTSNSFISMVSGSAVMDLAVWYPEQSATSPTPYPPTIQMGATNTWEPGFYNVKNVTLVNSYYGIIFYKSGETCPTINGVYGTPLKQGVEIDCIVDIGRIEHCDFSPRYWAGSGLPGSPQITNTAYTNWIYNNGTGVVMRRNDWSYTCYLSVEGYNKGFHAVKSRTQNATPNGHNYGFNFKNCKYGLYFEGNNTAGCMFTEVKTAGCEFGAYFSENAGGVAQFCKWDLSATKCAIYANKNASTKITMMESTIKAGKVLLQGGTFVAVNNNFNNPQPQIEFEANSRGDIIGNRSNKTWQISEKSVFQNIINHDQNLVKDLKPLPAYHEFIPQFKKPSRYTLYNVLNAPYNVNKGTITSIPATDATFGIQNALNAASTAGGGVVYLPPGHYRINGQLNIPSNVELKGSYDVGAFPMGPGTVLEIYNTATPAVIMQGNSGIRGIDFNYPNQILCTVLPNPIDYPFTIQGNGNGIYIVNVGMRATNRGVDLATKRCDNFYIDFLTGYFFREGVNIKNSDNGVLANMQCNTIVYNSGNEEKYGKYPNSNRPNCEGDGTKDPYFFNSENLTFLTLENVNNVLLYNDFNYNAVVGIHVKSNVNGLALGFALDDDRTGLLLDGSNIHLDFINLQCVALQRDATGNSHSSYGENSSYIKTTANYLANSEVNLFNSDYWGYAGESGIVMNGAGTLNLYGGNFEHSGKNSFARVNNGHLNIVGSVVNPPNGSSPTYNGSATGNITTIGSVIGGNATGNTNIKHLPTGSVNNCGVWTATATYTGGGAVGNIVCNNSNSWNSGWQNQGTGKGAVTVTVDMKSPQTFNQVILDYASAVNDGPETYILEISTNNSTWTEVARGSGRNTAMTMISFPTQTARYVRITKPESNTSNYWAIDNFYVANAITTNVVDIVAIPDGTPSIGGDDTPPQCDPIRTVRFQSNDNGGAVTAINLTDNDGTLQWTNNVNNNSAWYEIPVEGSTTDFYYKNVGTNKYLYRENTGKTPSDCSWEWEKMLLSTTNAKTDYYKFRTIASSWGNRYWIVNVAAADFNNVTKQGAFVLSGINNNHTTCGMPAYPAVVATALPNSNNYWHSTAVATVSASVANPDCTSSVNEPSYPAGYPKTMQMSNPLFWQFGSPKVNAAGNLTAATGNLYTADASARVWNINGVETLFVYASHDMEQAAGCDRMDRYHIFSTTDMLNWTDYGEIFKADDVPWHTGTFTNNSKFMWAPDCVYKNGKYYYYFPHPSQNSDDETGSWRENWRTGIAVSDHPASNFTILPEYLKGLNNGSQHQIDPCVFIDDDGQAYFYNGGGERCFGGKLKDNMIEIDGNMQEMQGLNNFHEGTWVHKYNGKYYLSYSDNSGGGEKNGDQLKYAVSDHPLGPWEYKGVYVYATGCGTNHGSIVKFKNKWYAFYHSDYISNSGEDGRSVHVDELFYNPDGSIQIVKNWGDPYNGPHNVIATANTTNIALKLEAEDFNNGGETYGYHDTKAYTYTNTNYRTVAGVNIENKNGGKTIGDIANKEFLRYTINVEKAGLYDIDCYVAAQNGNGTFHLNVNGVNKTGTKNVPNTGSWDTFVKITVSNVPLKLGENLFELRVENGNFNIDRYEFRKAQPYQGTAFKVNNVPGKVEAEDFDNGGAGVAYYDTTSGNQGGHNYRPGESVDIENSASSVHISHTSDGEWLKYTLNVTQSGIYDVTFRVATGNGSSGLLSLTFDDVYEYPSVSVTTTNWNTYTTVVLRGVELTQGTHLMTMTIGKNINVDWYEFTKAANIVPVTNVVITPKNQTLTTGETLTFSATVSPGNASNPNVTYSITNGGAFGKLNGNVLTTTEAGTITVRVSSVADITKYDEATITVEKPIVSNTLLRADDISIIAYNNTIRINGITKGEIVTIYNLLGKKIYCRKAVKNPEIIDFLNEGMYIVILENANVTQKVLLIK